MFRLNKYLFAIATVVVFSHPVFAQESESAEELAKKLANPVAALISVPFQLNYDENLGVDDTGDRFLMNFQPVVPITLNDDWNIISRTIVPVISQENVFGDGNKASGLGDTIQSVFFSPKAPTDSGWIWGVGPVFLLPTATDDKLGTDQWGAGPTAVALKQSGPWTYGILVNHVWSETGPENQQAISSTFLQPFWSFTTKTAVTFTLNTEASYNWRADSDKWAVPINAMVGKVFKLGSQMVMSRVGLRYWVAHTDAGAEGLAARFEVTLLFPK